jgi:DNA replication ATP-dependent helicase Dna2
MKQIEKQIGALLFDRILETISNDKLTPKERIPKFRNVLEDLFKSLNVDSKELLSTLHNRTTYIFREFEIPTDIQSKTNSIRLFSNKVVHENDFIPKILDEKRCVYQLSEILSYFSKIEIRKEIKDFYISQIDSIKKEEAFVRPNRPTYDFFGVIESIYLPKGETEKKVYIISCSTDELGLINLKIWNNKNESGFGSDLTCFAKIAKPYQYFYVTGVVQCKDKDDEYQTTQKSLIVLEPDYLIDAKELSECRQRSNKNFNHYDDNPLLYLLNRFNKGEVTDKIMVGNIVGQMLDDMVTTPEFNYQRSFEKVMRENSFGMLSIAHQNGNYEKEFIKKIYIRAEEHKQQLQKVIKDYKNLSRIIEPTFISNKYGLQGRLDLLIDYGKENNRKDIIELKSTKSFPNLRYGLYHNHEAQALCYELLLDSTYSNRTGSSSILYSSAPSEEMPLRSVAKEKYISIQDLLMLRNRIVANELSMAEGNFTAISVILSDDSGSYPPYLDDLLNDFRETIGSLNELLKQYFYGFVKFIFKELQVAKIGSSDIFSKSNGYADLWKASKADKIDNYDVLINLKIDNISDDYHLNLTFDQDLLSQSNITIISSFRVGDTAVLYPTSNQDELNPLKSQILKCRIVAITHNSVEISLVNKQVGKQYFASSIFWALERDFRENSYKQQLQLMYQFLKSDDRVINLILGKSRPQFKQNIPLLENDLDTVQKENVMKAISANDYYMIQGPPGTGKTSKVLVEIVRNLSVKDKDIIVLAFTNRAVDEICEKLVSKNVECIRLGKGEKPYYWSYLSDSMNLEHLSKKVINCRVIVSTISTFVGSLDILKFKNFETLIIDEASQILESQIVGILKHFNKWIFIGDENQLPAVVIQNSEVSKCDIKELQELSLNNFRESLFYRLKKNAVKKGWDDCYGKLKYQYRMHQDVAEFSKVHFYNNQLETILDKQKSPLVLKNKNEDSQLQEVMVKSRMIFIPTKIDKKSKVNDEEANIVSALIKHVAKVYGNEFDPEKTIGVITPFRAQIANIRDRLDLKLRNITIDTVERFQGSERDIIIISLAIRNTSQFAAIQSINDESVDRKLNVALTRAKEQVIILGSEDVLEKNELFNSLIEFIKVKGGYMVNPLKAKSIPDNLF